MKTIEQRDAMIHNLGMLFLISFFSIVWLKMDTEALPHLFHLIKAEWLHFSNWVASGMMSPHRTQW